jgi:hypothetical protein
MTNTKHQHKNLNPNNQNQQTNNTDNTTKVYIRLDEPKVTVSFRCNRELWKSFKKQIRAQGLSICHVLEPMIFGWLNGYVNICNSIKPIKIENITVERAVKRVRRYGVEVEGEDRDVCFYCLPRRVRAVGLFRYERTGEVFALCKSHAEALLESGVWKSV